MLETGSIIIFYAPFLLFIVGMGFCISDVVKRYRQNPLLKLKPSREQFGDFAILVLRWYLAYYMFSYGWDKLSGDQFGHRSDDILNTPLKDIDKFDLAWHLFGLDNTFNLLVGLTQMTAAVLIAINRTALVGALMLLPVLGQIFLIDLAFTSHLFGGALLMRLIGMVLSDLLVLYYYKDRMLLVWDNLTRGMSTTFKYKWWVFILLPLLALFTDLAIVILANPVKWLLGLLTK